MRLELSAITKRFGRATALDAIDLTIAPGSRVALLGPNGSGKTTLTRAILGLVRVDGAIRVDGAPLDAAALAARSAYVPQIAPQMAATVGEVIAAVCGLRDLAPSVVGEIAAELGLDVGAVRRRALRALSGGMRQKLLLALALATPAELVILDEPTASLDAAARARFFARFGRIAAGTTVILCSHRLDELRALVDHVVVMAEGRIGHSGPAAAYLAERLAGLIELRLRDGAGDGDGGAEWLAAHGFARGSGGWWSRAVTPADKLALVPEALAALGDAIDDLIVRDTDRLEMEAGLDHAA